MGLGRLPRRGYSVETGPRLRHRRGCRTPRAPSRWRLLLSTSSSRRSTRPSFLSTRRPSSDLLSARTGPGVRDSSFVDRGDAGGQVAATPRRASSVGRSRRRRGHDVHPPWTGRGDAAMCVVCVVRGQVAGLRRGRSAATCVGHRYRMAHAKKGEAVAEKVRTELVRPLFHWALAWYLGGGSAAWLAEMLFCDAISRVVGPAFLHPARSRASSFVLAVAAAAPRPQRGYSERVTASSAFLFSPRMTRAARDRRRGRGVAATRLRGPQQHTGLALLGARGDVVLHPDAPSGARLGARPFARAPLGVWRLRPRRVLRPEPVEARAAARGRVRRAAGAASGSAALDRSARVDARGLFTGAWGAGGGR